jgi:hypothetical protein
LPDAETYRSSPATDLFRGISQGGLGALVVRCQCSGLKAKVVQYFWILTSNFFFPETCFRLKGASRLQPAEKMDSK